jgi:hypothetical protein
MKKAMKLSAGDAACFPLPRLAGEGGPAGPGEGVHLSGDKSPQESIEPGRLVRFVLAALRAEGNDTLSRPCRGTLPRRAGEGKAGDGAAPPPKLEEGTAMARRSRARNDRSSLPIRKDFVFLCVSVSLWLMVLSFITIPRGAPAPVRYPSPAGPGSGRR